MTDKEIGLHLRKRRLVLRIAQGVISKKLKQPQDIICAYEKGRRKIPKMLLPQIAEAYQIPLFSLVTMVYEGKIPSLEKDNVLPHFKRIIDAGIESFSFLDLHELTEVEQALGFMMTSEQLKAWNTKQTSK